MLGISGYYVMVGFGEKANAEKLREDIVKDHGFCVDIIKVEDVA